MQAPVDTEPSNFLATFVTADGTFVRMCSKSLASSDREAAIAVSEKAVNLGIMHIDASTSTDARLPQSMPRTQI